MNTESQKLRALADAIDEADAIEKWAADGVPKEFDSLVIQVRWDWGSGVTGYRLVEERMRRKVKEHYREFLNQIVGEAHAAVEIARENLEKPDA